MFDIFRLRHRRLRGLLSAYIDGRVTGAQVDRLERHLRGCAGCRLELESLRATVDLLRSLPELAVPRSFRLTHVPEPAPAPFVMPRGLMAAASAAAVLLIALLAVDFSGIGAPGRIDLAATEVAVTRAIAEAPAVEEIEVAVEKILVGTPAPTPEALAVAEPDEAGEPVIEAVIEMESAVSLETMAVMEDSFLPTSEEAREPLVLEVAVSETIILESQAQLPVAPVEGRGEGPGGSAGPTDGAESFRAKEVGPGFPYLPLEIAAGTVLALLLGGLLVLFRRRAVR